MRQPAPALLAEVPEDAATGELARIYDEIRRCSGVPYVSSLQRYLASMPGVLEFAWAAIGPACHDGRLPETAWRLVAGLPGAPLPPLSPAALRLLGVDAEGTQAIRNICDNFIRVAPVNLLFAACLERLLAGAKPGGRAGGAGHWTPPALLPGLPAMVEVGTAPEEVRQVLLGLAAEVDGKPFVPGLYRLIARWPAYLAHAATEIAPELRSEAAKGERAGIAERIVAAADDVIAALPPLDGARRAPGAEAARAVVQAIRGYRVTSPEMIVFSTRLRDALPA